MKEIILLIKQIFEAMAGRETFESWLETIGAFTDKEIRDAAVQGERFLEGHCVVFINDKNLVEAQIKMQFADAQNRLTQKIARREFPLKHFMTNELERLKKEGRCVFDVLPPSDM